jgi:hypothetical protein
MECSDCIPPGPEHRSEPGVLFSDASANHGPKRKTHPLFGRQAAILIQNHPQILLQTLLFVARVLAKFIKAPLTVLAKAWG